MIDSTSALVNMRIAMISTARVGVRAVCVCAVLFPVLVSASSLDIPLMRGMVLVLATSNRMPVQSADKIDHVAQGDYELIVTITAVSKEGITQSAFIDGVDEGGVKRQVSVPRLVRTEDLANSRLQVLGFYSSDPTILNGTTSLGPSLLIFQELTANGSAAYSMKNFWSQDTLSGTLTRSKPDTVSFPVLVNGRRVELEALHATGMMAIGSTTRPFEQYILDDPRQPISLRIAWGPRGGSFPFVPDFTRDLVRVDFPANGALPLTQELSRSCRVELPGIYFDFNEATLKPQSKAELEAVAAALRTRPRQRFRIEGHTDNIGGDRYNDDLSARRAAAVKATLVRDFGLDSANISTQGFGARHPVETNETLAGRARNRRVELVRECAGADS
jgi:hypothetical protein